jgi:hypothetical protein
LKIKFHFLDHKVKALGLHQAATVGEVITELASKIGLLDTDGWGIFEHTPEGDHYLRGPEYVGDVLSEWEAAKRNSMQPSKYLTLSRKNAQATTALGGGDCKFYFRKRLFKPGKDVPKDPVEYNLLFAQAVYSVVVSDDYAITDKIALQLAGLQAQVLWGNADPSHMSRYDEVQIDMHAHKYI